VRFEHPHAARHTRGCSGGRRGHRVRRPSQQGAVGAELRQERLALVGQPLASRAISGIGQAGKVARICSASWRPAACRACRSQPGPHAARSGEQVAAGAVLVLLRQLEVGSYIVEVHNVRREQCPLGGTHCPCLAQPAARRLVVTPHSGLKSRESRVRQLLVPAERCVDRPFDALYMGTRSRPSGR
jgi:hypothetical protein